MSFQWLRMPASRLISWFPSFTFVAQVAGSASERADHQLASGLKMKLTPTNSADRRDGQHHQKLLAVFNFHCAPPFPYWKSNVNCIGALPRIRSTFKSLTPSALLNFASIASSDALSCALPEQVTVPSSLDVDGLGRHHAVFGKRQRQLPQNRQVAERIVIPRTDTAGFGPARPAIPRLSPDMPDHCERSRHSWICWNKNSPSDNRHDARGHRARRPQPARRILRGKLLEERRLRRQKFKHRRLLRQQPRREAERRRQRRVRRKLHAKFIRRVGRNDFHVQTHRLEAQFHFVRELLRQFARAENADALHRVAQFGGQLAERDARLARDQVRRPACGGRLRFSIAPSSARNAATPPPQVICSDTCFRRSPAPARRWIFPPPAAATPQVRARS